MVEYVSECCNVAYDCDLMMCTRCQEPSDYCEEGEQEE